MKQYDLILIFYIIFLYFLYYLSIINLSILTLSILTWFILTLSILTWSILIQFNQGLIPINRQHNTNSWPNIYAGSLIALVKDSSLISMSLPSGPTISTF